MDNLDVILQEILCSAVNRIIENEEKILKSLNGLTLKEFHTLDVINATTRAKTNTSANIAKVLSITPGTLTINLDRLEAKGYVCKQKSEQDKRVTLITLTQLGINIRKKREMCHRKLVDQAVGKLSPSEKVALSNALNKIDF